MTQTKPFLNIDLKGDCDTINQPDIEKFGFLNISLNKLKQIMRDSNSLKIEFYSLSLKYPFKNLIKDLSLLYKNLSTAKMIVIISVAINSDVNLTDIKNISEIFSDITDNNTQVKVSVCYNEQLNSEVILDILIFN